MGKHARWAGPLFEGHVCSVGYEVVDQIEAFMCHGEGDLQGQSPTIDQEMVDHIVECYRIDPVTGRRVYNEAVLSRPKGRAKSEIAAWCATAEAFLRVRFDGWDANGQPIARAVSTPLVKCLATEEGQAGNTFKTIAFIAGEWGMDNHPDVFGGAGGVRRYQSASAIYLPHGGEVRASTSGSASKDGGLETHVVADETHLYVLKELRDMYATIARNMGKRFDADPWLHQTSTAYRPGEQSVFEETLTMWRKGELPESVFVNHRQASGKVNIWDTEHTIKQLREVYGPAAEWIDLDRKVRDMRDPRVCRDEATAARYFLNRPMSTQDAWLPVAVYDKQVRPHPDKPDENPSRWTVAAKTAITLGFDGSLNDDSTVLRGCRMSDGYRFTLGIWEKPAGAVAWEVPRRDVLTVIREAFVDYDVIRGYFDPHEWRSDIDALAEHVDEVHGKVKLPGEKEPQPRVVPFATSQEVAMGRALDRLHTDLVNGETFHDADKRAREHYGNTYVRRKGHNRLVRKDTPNSSRKIDTVVGDALAYQARADVLELGWTPEPVQTTRKVVHLTR